MRLSVVSALLMTAALAGCRGAGPVAEPPQPDAAGDIPGLLDEARAAIAGGRPDRAAALCDRVLAVWPECFTAAALRDDLRASRAPARGAVGGSDLLVSAMAVDEIIRQKAWAEYRIAMEQAERRLLAGDFAGAEAWVDRAEAVAAADALHLPGRGAGWTGRAGALRDRVRQARPE
jgi:hypothetical protein